MKAQLNFALILMICICFLILGVIICSDVIIESDYTAIYKTDKIEYIPAIITNAMEDVKLHNFEIIGLEVLYKKIPATFTVKCYGKDKKGFISYDN